MPESLPSPPRQETSQPGYLVASFHAIGRLQQRRGSAVIPAKYGRQLTIGEAAVSWSLRHLPIKHGTHRLLDRIRPKPSFEGIVACNFHGKTLGHRHIRSSGLAFPDVAGLSS